VSERARARARARAREVDHGVPERHRSGGDREENDLAVLLPKGPVEPALQETHTHTHTHTFSKIREFPSIRAP